MPLDFNLRIKNVGPTNLGYHKMLLYIIMIDNRLYLFQKADFKFKSKY